MRSLLVGLALFALTGCAGGSDDDRPTVVAAAYPLAWAAAEIASDDVRVVDLTPAGGEPHDVELSPRDVEAIDDAELVVYVGGGFQPAVEDAVARREGPSLDLARGDSDPHVWLDPVAFAGAAERIGQALDRRPAARRLARELAALDRDFAAGLERCERRTIVTAHAAFGRLAARYGLTQVALTGTAPEAEPGPRAVERLVDEVRRSGASVVFAEPLVSDRLAETVAREAGVELALLDPVEALTDERVRAGADYLTVMRDNLATLREALACR